MSQKTPDGPVVLTEYDSAAIELDANQVRVLRRLARGAITLQPDDTASSWCITSSHYVGTIVTPQVRILITPKVDTANLFYLLEASGKPVDIGPAVFDYETTGDLIPSFATFYARHLEKALGHGVPRAYQETRERLPALCSGRAVKPASWARHGVRRCGGGLDERDGEGPGRWPAARAGHLPRPWPDHGTAGRSGWPAARDRQHPRPSRREVSSHAAA